MKVRMRNDRLFLAATLLALPLFTACAADEESATTTQDLQPALGPDCIVQRPYGWESAVAECSEGGSDEQLILAPGEPFEFFSAPFVDLGSGHVIITCDANGDGLWKESSKVCKPSSTIGE
jgi:hypothetical protein